MPPIRHSLLMFLANFEFLQTDLMYRDGPRLRDPAEASSRNPGLHVDHPLSETSSVNGGAVAHFYSRRGFIFAMLIIMNISVPYVGE